MKATSQTGAEAVCEHEDGGRAKNLQRALLTTTERTSRHISCSEMPSGKKMIQWKSLRNASLHRLQFPPVHGCSYCGCSGRGATIHRATLKARATEFRKRPTRTMAMCGRTKPMLSELESGSSVRKSVGKFRWMFLQESSRQQRSRRSKLRRPLPSSNSGKWFRLRKFLLPPPPPAGAKHMTSLKQSEISEWT